ncbi:MAG: hypothetical protein DLM58_23440 [Pseudonocardiales bacterium]|nr:MAG: hypothetical protein DLM58_23440 [Pseudonocardiales bacterium]
MKSTSTASANEMHPQGRDLRRYDAMLAGGASQPKALRSSAGRQVRNEKHNPTSTGRPMP